MQCLLSYSLSMLCFLSARLACSSFLAFFIFHGVNRVTTESSYFVKNPRTTNIEVEVVPRVHAGASAHEQVMAMKTGSTISFYV